jgi:16S rRNA (guanine1207-N2)-methyltransferase
MTVRLSLAIDAGLVVPQTGSDDGSTQGMVAILHPPIGLDLADLDHSLGRGRCVIVSPSKPVHDAYSAAGWRCETAMPTEVDGTVAGGAVVDGPVVDGAVVDATVVFLPRAKDLARDLLSRLHGLVIVDGAKTDGIDSMFKAVRARVSDVNGPINKAHGKQFWFNATGDQFLDWRSTGGDADGLKTVAGVFSADAIDPASQMLAAALPAKLGTRVADLGAGWGYLSREILTRDQVKTLHLIEADNRALACARANITDARAQFHWADATSWTPKEPVQTVVMNPPFHNGRSQDPDLGRAFIATAARALTGMGELWLVANRHLPYEETLRAKFSTVEEVAGDRRFKVIHATRPLQKAR